MSMDVYVSMDVYIIISVCTCVSRVLSWFTFLKYWEGGGGGGDSSKPVRILYVIRCHSDVTGSSKASWKAHRAYWSSWLPNSCNDIYFPITFAYSKYAYMYQMCLQHQELMSGEGACNYRIRPSAVEIQIIS